MLHIKWGELFPTKISLITFISYMALFINQGILVTASQSSDKKYNYSTTFVVLLTEVLKLILSVGLFCKDGTFCEMLRLVYGNIPLLGLYFVPSLLYCFYNNLSFINLASFDPTTYYLLLQFRNVITAILFQIIFHKKLSQRQWFSLILLTIGCMIKHFHFVVDQNSSTEKNVWSELFHINTSLILIQGFCSCLAGVYNEYLLKSHGQNVNIYVQNVLMYLDSVVCNLIIIIFQGKTTEIFSSESAMSILRWNILVIIINNALIGVVTSFFLKTMNSILKTFASALELSFTAIACYFIFGIPITFFTVLSILIVSVSVILYSQNPVDNTPKTTQSQDKVHLLEEGEH